MNTTTAAPAASIRTADMADELAAGRPFPMRNALVPMSHAAAVALFVARREFWLDAAADYVRLVELGCTDAEHDVREALAQAELYAPTA